MRNTYIPVFQSGMSNLSGNFVSYILCASSSTILLFSHSAFRMHPTEHSEGPTRQTNCNWDELLVFCCCFHSPFFGGIYQALTLFGIYIRVQAVKLKQARSQITMQRLIFRVNLFSIIFRPAFGNCIAASQIPFRTCSNARTCQ